MVRPYQKLIVRLEAHKLCLSIYKVTKAFPNNERFRLADQACRALAKDLDYMSTDTYASLDSHIQRVSYLLVKLRKSIKYPTSQTS